MQGDGYAHGGDVYGLSGAPLDFSINLNPLGIPDGVAAHVAKHLFDPPRYPDPRCRSLTCAAARLEQIPASWYLWGNGAADLIYRLATALRPRRALLPAPTFTEYEKALSVNGCNVIYHYTNWRDHFALRSSFLQQLAPGIELVILCDPNNPTGSYCDEPLLRAILGRCREIGALLVVDQCFLELSGGARSYLLDEVGAGGLLLLRALTKSYALAGFRLGYCLCADESLLCRMERHGQPWPVSQPAMLAGEIALQEFPQWPYAANDLVCAERPRIQAALAGIGAAVADSQSNFLMFYHPDERLRARMLSRGILIRDCRDMAGCSAGGYYRVAVRAREENDRLIYALNSLEESGNNG